LTIKHNLTFRLNFKKLISYTELDGFNVSILAKKKLFFEELILVEAVKLFS